MSQWNNGVFEFQRTGSQAVVFESTGQAFAAGAPLVASFQLGNTDSVRKRMSVLVHEGDFSDLHVCTFWLPANFPFTTFGMRTHTTKPWTNLTVSFYAATVGTGGFCRLDNVSVGYAPDVSAVRTDCVDPNVPASSGGPAGPTMLANGDFAVGLPPWTTFGQIQGQVSGGVFEFVKPAGQPAGVVLQATGQALAAGELVTATFDLGNSSAVRKRVTVILHDNSFGDLSACTFWLAPGQPLSTYTYRTYATQAWTNATLSIYPATVGAEQWIRLDNATLKRTPSAVITGTQCLEPGASPDLDTWTARALATPGMAPMFGGTSAAAVSFENSVFSPDFGLTGEWEADGFSPDSERFNADGPGWMAALSSGEQRTLTSPPINSPRMTLQFESWLAGSTGRGLVQVSDDGVTWSSVYVVAPSDGWISSSVEIEIGWPAARVRFAWSGDGGPLDGEPAVWRLAAIRVLWPSRSSLER